MTSVSVETMLHPPPLCSHSYSPPFLVESRQVVLPSLRTLSEIYNGILLPNHLPIYLLI